MNFENYFPLWNDLNTAQKKLISDNLITQNVKLTSPCIIYPSLIFATVIYYNQYIFIYGICQLYN